MSSSIETSDGGYPTLERVGLYSRGQSWLMIVWALIIRDFDYRFRVSPWHGIAVVAEPLLLVAIVTSIRVFFFNSMPVYGSSLVLFHATGIFPFQLFLLCSAGVRRTRLDLDDYPIIQDIDVVVARVLIELFDILVTTFLFHVGMALYGLEFSTPFDPLRAAAALGLLTTLAFGVGMINSAIESVLPIWKPIYASVSRSFLLLSGVLFVSAFVPNPARSWIAWNPILHGVDYYRSAFYPHYPVNILSVSFLASCAVGSVIVGGLLFANRVREL